MNPENPVTYMLMLGAAGLVILLTRWFKERRNAPVGVDDRQAEQEHSNKD